MYGYRNELIYWLFFCTNDLKGLYEMKCAMWKADPTGQFSFADADDGQMMFLPLIAFTDENLEAILLDRFQTHEVSVGEIEEFVLTETPAHRFKQVLTSMKKKHQLEVLDAREKGRKGGFSDTSMRVRFRRALQQPDLF